MSRLAVAAVVLAIAAAGVAFRLLQHRAALAADPLQCGAQLDTAVLWEEVEVGTAARLTGCLIGRGVSIGAHTRVTPGAVLGDGTRLGDYSRLAGDP